MKFEGINIQSVFSVLLVVLTALCIYYLVNIGNRFVEEDNRISLNAKKVARIVSIVIAVALIFVIFKRFSILGDMIITFILALVFAYIFNPLVDMLEKKIKKRSLSILALYVIIVGVFVLLGILVVPQIAEEIGKFIRNIPFWIEKVIRSINTFADQLTLDGSLPDDFIDSASEQVIQKLNELQATAINGISSVSDVFSSFAGRLVRIILIPVVAYYLLKDRDEIVEAVVKKVPEGNRESFYETARDIDQTLSEFVRGRLIMAAFVGVSTTILLFILGLDYAIVIGMITAIADIIPYIGPLLGFVPAVAIAFVKSPLLALWVAAAYVIIQWVENNIIGPRILGDSTGLHPLIVLLCLVVGGGMFGVIGMIFSVPVVAVIRILYVKFFPILRRLFQETGTENDKGN